MPIYEYQCAACEHQFEEWQKMSDPPVRVCPSCKAEKVERLISATAFHLKGGGWYSDLYSSTKPGAKGSDTSASKSSESKSTSSDSSTSTSSNSSAPSSSSGSSGGGDKGGSSGGSSST